MEIRGHDNNTVSVSYTSMGCFGFANSPRTRLLTYDLDTLST